MNRVLLVGMCPPASVGHLPAPFYALTGACGRRLAELAGLGWLEYLHRTERTNLLDEWPGECWPTWYARKQAREMEPRLAGRTALLMGRAVATAFGLGTWHYLEFWPTDLAAGRMAVLPHPSGRNRWFNEPANRIACEVFLQGVFEQ